jgi:hypothetical protein
MNKMNIKKAKQIVKDSPISDYIIEYTLKLSDREWNKMIESAQINSKNFKEWEKQMPPYDGPLNEKWSPSLIFINQFIEGMAKHNNLSIERTERIVLPMIMLMDDQIKNDYIAYEMLQQVRILQFIKKS